MDESTWQEIPENSQMAHVYVYSARLKVPGGWLVRIVVTYASYKSGGGVAVDQKFISDPQHEWQLPEVKESTSGG